MSEQSLGVNEVGVEIGDKTEHGTKKLETSETTNIVNLERVGKLAQQEVESAKKLEITRFGSYNELLDYYQVTGDKLGYDIQRTIPGIVDTSGERVRILSRLEMLLLDKGQSLPNFSIEIRQMAGKAISLVGWDVDEFRRIVVGIGAETKANSSLGETGKAHLYALMDSRDAEGVIDLLSLVKGQADVYVAANELDFTGEKNSSQGATDEKSIESRLITSAQKLGTYLHEVGHHRFYQARVENLDPVEQGAYTDAFGNAKFGEFSQNDLEVFGLEEETASEIGVALARNLFRNHEDEFVLQTIEYLGEVARRYKDKVARAEAEL